MVRVWTRQKKSVLEELRKTGRYTAKRKYIEMDLTEHAALVLEPTTGWWPMGRTQPPAEGCGISGLGGIFERDSHDTGGRGRWFWNSPWSLSRLPILI